MLTVLRTGFYMEKLLIPAFKKSKNEILENYRPVSFTLVHGKVLKTMLEAIYKHTQHKKYDRQLSVWIWEEEITPSMIRLFWWTSSGCNLFRLWKHFLHYLQYHSYRNELNKGGGRWTDNWLKGSKGCSQW